MRPTMSLLPDGGNGTISRTGRLGQSSARADASVIRASAIVRTMRRIGAFPPSNGSRLEIRPDLDEDFPSL